LPFLHLINALRPNKFVLISLHIEGAQGVAVKWPRCSSARGSEEEFTFDFHDDTCAAVRPTLLWSIENLYSPENDRNNNVLKTVQINSKVTQIMTPTANVNEHTTYTKLLLFRANRKNTKLQGKMVIKCSALVGRLKPQQTAHISPAHPHTLLLLTHLCHSTHKDHVT